ncbi:MAG: recombination protein RecR [Mycoplasmoidaceae bacterium]|nr:recombination protein RecR [Mycoplasmoidaceae bacterium]
MRPKEFEYLVDAIKSLPSVGTKAAERIAYHLIHQDQHYIDEFIKRISSAKNNIKFCKQCGNFALDDLCTICSNPERDNSKLCIVNTIDELNKIESTGCFNGIYFVLNDEINVKTKKKIESSIIQKLMNYCASKDFKEAIIATNLTINGEAANICMNKLLKDILPDCLTYKLAIGLPVNSALDYADENTLKQAIKNKTRIQFYFFVLSQ